MGDSSSDHKHFLEQENVQFLEEKNPQDFPKQQSIEWIRGLLWVRGAWVPASHCIINLQAQVYLQNRSPASWRYFQMHLVPFLEERLPAAPTEKAFLPTDICGWDCRLKGHHAECVFAACVDTQSLQPP